METKAITPTKTGEGSKTATTAVDRGRWIDFRRYGPRYCFLPVLFLHFLLLSRSVGLLIPSSLPLSFTSITKNKDDDTLYYFAAAKKKTLYLSIHSGGH